MANSESILSKVYRQGFSSGLKKDDIESDSILSKALPDHWAYRQGFSSGLKKDRAERGLMRFGLYFAANQETTDNTRQWLAGFYYGLQEAKNPKQNPARIWSPMYD